MNVEEKRSLVRRYINAYNTFDIEGMMSLLHTGIEFKNISNGEVNVTAYGKEEFRLLADQSKNVFSSRTQTIKGFKDRDDKIRIDLIYEGVLISDLPNGMKAGETLVMNGCSEFSFREGKIIQLTDIC